MRRRKHPFYLSLLFRILLFLISRSEAVAIGWCCGQWEYPIFNHSRTREKLCVDGMDRVEACVEASGCGGEKPLYIGA